jgi:hypothetical protein
MDESRFATWKYEYEGPGTRSRLQYWFAAGFFCGSLLARQIWPLALFLLAISLFILVFTRKTLLINARYLICGEHIVYFANVVRVERDDSAGKLLLVSADGSRLLLERDKFPTNARKTDKIARNKATKFDKVAGHLTERVRRASPAAEFS